MLDAPDYYRAALEAIGVPHKDIDDLVPPSEQDAFLSEVRARCREFLEGKGLSTRELMHGTQPVGFANQRSHGVWCSFTDALAFANSIALAEVDQSANLFCLEMDARGYTGISPGDVVAGQVEPDIALRWEAFRLGQEFWHSQAWSTHAAPRSTTP